MADKTFKFKFTGDSDDLARSTLQVERSVGGLGSKLSTAAKVIGGAMAAAFAIDKIVSFGSELYGLGNQAQIYGIKAATVFGDQLGIMEEWAAANAGAMGMTRTELLGLGAGMADLLVPMGFTREQAAAMTQDVGGLSGALSAWSGGTMSAAQVQEILAKALLGERDGLKALGISISQAEVDTRAFAIAQAEGRTEVTQMDQALATQQLIMEKSTDAQAAWADGSFDAQKKQAELTAQIKELKEALGTALLPIVQAVTAWIVDKFIPAMSDLKEWMWPKIQAAHDSLVSWWSSNGPAIVAFAVGIKDAAIELGEGIMKMWEGHIKPAVDSVLKAWGDLKTEMGKLKTAVVGDGDSIGVSWKTVGQVIGLVISGGISAIANIVKAISGLVSAATVMATRIRTAADAVGTAWNGMKSTANSMTGPISGAFNAIMGVVNQAKNVIDALKRAWDSVRSALGARISVPTPNWPSVPSWVRKYVPGFHAGTHSVPGAPGQDVPTVLQAGERVMSVAQVRQSDRGGGSGSGNSITINAYGVTGREMVAEIERAVRDGVRANWLGGVA